MDNSRQVATQRQNYVDPEVQTEAYLEEHANGWQKNGEYKPNEIHANSNRLFQ